MDNIKQNRDRECRMSLPLCADLSRLLQQQEQEVNNGSSSGGNKAVTSLLDLDMTGIHSAVHVARSLGQLDAFREHYLDQRRLQISADLQPPLSFLESYQSYLAQVGSASVCF